MEYFVEFGSPWSGFVVWKRPACTFLKMFPFVFHVVWNDMNNNNTMKCMIECFEKRKQSHADPGQVKTVFL